MIWIIEVFEYRLIIPFQAKDASRQPWPGARGASRQSFLGFLSIGNMLVFTIIFDIYDTYGAEVSDHMSLPYSFSFNYHK